MCIGEDTWLHRLHPLTKVAWLAWLTVAVFLTDNPVFCWTVAAAAGMWLRYAGRPSGALAALRFGLACAGLLIILHVLLTPTARPAAWSGLVRGLAVAGRVLAVVLLSTTFVATTPPADLGQALARLGVPYRWCFSLTTAIRLTSLFRVEADQIYRAQLARGVPYDAGRLRKTWLLLRRWCLPLLVAALRTAQSLSWAMEGRAFGRYRQRTYLRPLTTGRRDLWAGIALVGTLIAFIYGRASGVL